MRFVVFFLLTAAGALAQNNWQTNQVEPYSPSLNVPGVTIPGMTIPQASSVEIFSITNAPPPPIKPKPRPPNSYLPVPTANDMAHRSMILTTPKFMQPNVGTTPLTNAGTTTAATSSGTTIGSSLAKPVLFNTTEAAAILAGLQIFPADNPWHQKISGWPVHANSKKIITAIGESLPLRFNLDMSFVLVPQDQPRQDVDILLFPRESDPGPYPVPDNLPIEGWPAYYTRSNQSTTLDDVQRDRLNIGGDRHAIIVDPVRGTLYEFFAMRKTLSGWKASQASIFDLKTNKLRPDGWTSADAAGLPIFPAIVRYDELKRGVINHALRVTVRQSRRDYVAPATHFASNSDDQPAAHGRTPPLETRLRHHRLRPRSAHHSHRAQDPRHVRRRQRQPLRHLHRPRRTHAGYARSIR